MLCSHCWNRGWFSHAFYSPNSQQESHLSTEPGVSLESPGMAQTPNQNLSAALPSEKHYLMPQINLMHRAPDSALCTGCLFVPKSCEKIKQTVPGTLASSKWQEKDQVAPTCIKVGEAAKGSGKVKREYCFTLGRSRRA